MKWLLVLLIVGCAAPPTLRRAMNREARQDYVMLYGANMNWQLQKCFVEGRVCIGMPADYVVALLGRPSQIISGEYRITQEVIIREGDGIATWVWYLEGNKEVYLTSIKFITGLVMEVEGQAADEDPWF